jgi:peptidoglycan/LPS O-acetylase OafA/YrhL
MVAGGWIFASSYIFGLGYYLDTILFAIVVAGFASHHFPSFIRRADKVLGEWAYSVFLVQWLAGFVVTVAFHSGQSRGWAIFLAATPVAILSSAMLTLLNKRIVEPFRDRARNSSISSQLDSSEHLFLKVRP